MNTEAQNTTHTYENDSCCSTNKKTHNHADHDHGDHGGGFKTYIPGIFSFVMLVVGLALDYFEVDFFKEYIRLAWYIIAYIPVGFPVMKEGWESIRNGDFFTSFNLSSGSNPPFA